MIPGNVVYKLVHSCIFWLNLFPPSHIGANNGIPRTIVIGHKVYLKTHFGIDFFSFDQTHEKHVNSMVCITNRVIYMKLSGNMQDVY